eukprot:s212_g28.t1
MSKLPRSESVGALSQRETEVAAGLIHRAIVHEQGNAIVQKVASHIHGKQIAVHVQSLVEECQGMSDASKRRLDAETDAGSWAHVISDDEFDPSCMPMPSAGYVKENPKGNNKAKLAHHMPDVVHPEVPCPPGVKDVHEWSRTIVSMKKYADEVAKYLAWIQKTYTPEVDRMKTVKRTQAVDLAMFLKMTGCSADAPEEFVRRSSPIRPEQPEENRQSDQTQTGGHGPQNDEDPTGHSKGGKMRNQPGARDVQPAATAAQNDAAAAVATMRCCQGRLSHQMEPQEGIVPGSPTLANSMRAPLPMPRRTSAQLCSVETN